MVTETLELGEAATFELVGLQAIEVVGAEIAVGGLACEQVVSDLLAVAPEMIHGGESSVIGPRWSGLWDFQNQHATIAFTADGLSRDMVVDEEVPQEYDNITRYSTPFGAMTVMR